jgi:hypothetical protein
VEIAHSKPDAAKVALSKVLELMTHGFIIRFLSTFVNLYYKGAPVISVDATSRQKSFNIETIKRIMTNTTPLAQSFPEGMIQAL